MTENRQPEPPVGAEEARDARPSAEDERDSRADAARDRPSELSADERVEAEPVAPATPFDPNATIKHLTHKPGVYRMLDAAGEVIYVGKARDLRKRVASYFQGGRAQDAKTIAWCARSPA